MSGFIVIVTYKPKSGKSSDDALATISTHAAPPPGRTLNRQGELILDEGLDPEKWGLILRERKWRRRQRDATFAESEADYFVLDRVPVQRSRG
jgi:hypothetical protein